MKRHWHAGLNTLVILVLALALLPFAGGIVPVQADAPTELFFSEYIEGSSSNKALEIYNGTGAAVDLAAGAYSVQMFFNGSPTAGLTINLTGSVASGAVFVLANSSANPVILALANQTLGSGFYNGDDTVVLRKAGVIIDAIGQIGVDPGTEWGSGLTSTADNTLRRKNTLSSGDLDGSDPFDPSLGWDGFASDSFDGLGSHTVVDEGDAAPTVSGTAPANGGLAAVDQTFSVTFSEPVNLTDPAFSLTCSASGSHDLAVSDGPTGFTLDPLADFALGESCTLTILAAQVTDQDTQDPPDGMAADVTVNFNTPALDYCTAGAAAVTPISAVQGSGPISPLVTNTVTVRGVVVSDNEGASPTLRGFYLQDPTGDGDPATSDGLFVFNGSNNRVNLGDLVAVTGTVSEFEGQTQLSTASSGIVACGTGSVPPAEISLPWASLEDPERFEGMLVHLAQTLTVTEHFQLGRFGQVVLSSGGRLGQPTNLVAPGPAANALQAENNLNRILLDDALNNQNADPIVFGREGQPLSAANTLRGGDTLTGVTGVLTYTWAGNSASPNAYRLRPLNALGGGVPFFTAANPRPALPAELGGKLKVAGMNLLNYFNTFDGASSSPPYACNLGVGGALTNCRGADDGGEFARQWTKTVAAILAINPDVLGIIEIENDGYGPDSAIQNLVNQLNAATAAGTYAFIDVDAATGQVNALGTDAIKVGLLYQPARVTPVGTAAALNKLDFVNGGDGTPRNRPALAQAFELPDGGRFVVSVNHLKSKGSACDALDAGDGQGNCNAVRTTAARLLAEWLATDPTGAGDPDVLILGDLNAYAKEDPISTLEGFGYANIIEDFIGAEAYSYAFDGQWGYLDHALASPSLASQVSGVQEFHINADEPSVLDYNDDFKTASQIASLFNPDMYRVSDHDPVLVGLNVNAPPSTGPITAPLTPQRVGTSVTASLPFSDPDGAEAHTALFDWGDGATSPGTVVEANGVGSASASHVYMQPGVYPLTVTISDPYGHTAQASFLSVVVYDPQAGWVTGSGWVLSPAGAYRSDPSWTGKATFDFGVKYKKNATVPAGTTPFIFRAGALKYKATNYDWMVVSGAVVQVRGSGTISGQGQYGFLLTVSDSSPNLFHLKIWEQATGNLIYDNQPGAALGGGSIKIHK